MSVYSPDFEKYEQFVEKKFVEKFNFFAELLKEYNKKYNLTSITEEREVKYKHFIDSLAGESFFFSGANVLEVGSGAGFPSLPLKIVREDLQFTLVESTGKKCEFLKTAVKELGLNGVELVNARAEELAHDEHYREKFDVCCARAVARLNTLCEYCIPFVKVGGSMIAYKGEAEEEIKEAKNAIRILGGERIKEYSYELPENFGKRTLIVLSKDHPTALKYPRGNGKERKSPLL